MFRRVFLASVILLVGLAAAVHAQEVQLKLKFKEGDIFWMEDVATVKQSMKFDMPGVPAMQLETKTTMITKYTVKKVSSEGIELTMKIESMEAKLAGIGEQPPDVFEKIKGSVLTIKLTPEGKVAKVEGFDELTKKLTEGDDPAAMILKEIVKEEMFTKGVEQAFSFLPDGPVKKGDSWKRESKFPGGPVGEFKTKNTFTYNGKVDGGEEIGVKQTMEYAAPKEGGLMGGLVKIVKADLKCERASGTLLFDAEKGHLISATSTNLISGSMTMEIGGMETTVEMTMENSSATKVHDKNPNKK